MHKRALFLQHRGRYPVAMTELLYYDDPMQRAFTGRIIKMGTDGTTVVLDRTGFYPEGGGQPGDTGVIAGMPVNDTQKGGGGEVIHHLTTPIERSVGDEVTATIDWNHRFEYMQQHTGQHVLSGALAQTAGAATVSVHQGRDVTTIEVDTDSIRETILADVDSLANKIIAADRPITTRWVDDNELLHLKLRRQTTRRGKVRLVEIADFDLVACGGVHLPRTGLLNLVQLVGIERIRGRLRLSYMIGDRALDDYRKKHAVATDIAVLFSSRVDNAHKRVETMITELKENNGLVKHLGQRLADSILDSLKPVDGIQTIELSNENGDLFAAIGERAGKSEDRQLIMTNHSPERIDWAIVVGSAYPFPAEALRARVLDATGAKGGGKPPLWRGVIQASDAETANRFVKLAREVLSDQLP